MSTLWTPSGEHVPDDDGTPHSGPPQGGPPPGPPPGSPGGREPTEEEIAAAQAEMARVQQELLGTPVAEIIANHCIGLWQLAVLHLSQPDPDLDSAQTAIDGLAGIVEALDDRLAPNADALREALAQVRLAYVQVSSGEVPGGPDADGA